MSINLVVLDGVVKSLALRYGADGKAEVRWTLAQTEHATDGKAWTSFWPCTAGGSTAERLASDLEDGQHIIVTSGKLCYRKREGKMGLQSRMEILVWTVDRLGEAPKISSEYSDGSDPGALIQEPASVPESKNVRKRAVPKHLQVPWPGKKSALQN